MILLNHFKIVFFISLLTLFISCEKETVEPFDKSLYEGTFHCRITETSNGLGLYSRIHYDQIINVYVENDTIKFLDYKVPIDSMGQTEFCLGHNRPRATKIYSRKFNYLDDFEYISYSYESHDIYYPANSNSSTQIGGPRTLLTETLDEAPDSLKGNYLLTVRDKDPSANLDTQYVAINYVTRNAGRISVDGNHLYSTPNFHSFFRSEHTDDQITFYTEGNVSINWTPRNFSYTMNREETNPPLTSTYLKRYIGPRN